MKRSEIRVKPIRCPRCDNILDALAALDGEDPHPQPGSLNVAVCSSCGHLMALGVDRKIRELTADERAVIEHDPAVAAARRRAVN
jgi:C4-type Zn-finger protein